MNEIELTRLEEFRQLKREIPNPPPKVLCSSDYRVQRADVASLVTVSPACGCGFDQNDRADTNPLPSVDRSLSL